MRDVWTALGGLSESHGLLLAHHGSPALCERMKAFHERVHAVAAGCTCASASLRRAAIILTTRLELKLDPLVGRTCLGRFFCVPIE